MSAAVTFPVLKAFAALLSYPDEALRAVLPEIHGIVDGERRLGRRERAALHALVATLAQGDLIDAQERYVALFDRGRATSLNLYEHVHGDSRDRGQAMIDLMQIYERAGLELSTRELPDHLPVLLEFLSTRSWDEVREMLADCAHLLRHIGNALLERHSPYAAVLAALLALVSEQGLDSVAELPTAEEKSLDEEWAEAPVLFGLGCGDARDGASTAKPLHFVRRPV
ncbi:MAG TPA: nitrate reductase molybdenum cofactor assembly chaperone [Casimicrobiaceae bacterium]|nr:nitrate reductase molybdenum cofactor assembly chaperone [Casimicrobiaceae bacterium]